LGEDNSDASCERKETSTLLEFELFNLWINFLFRLEYDKA